MEYIKVRIKVINPNENMIKNGMDKILILINKNEIEDYYDFINIINEYFQKYGKIERLMDKEGFLIINNNKINFWNYINDNDEILVKLKKKNNNVNTKTITLIKDESDSNSYFSEDNIISNKFTHKLIKNSSSEDSKEKKQNYEIKESINVKNNYNDKEKNDNNEQYLNKKRKQKKNKNNKKSHNNNNNNNEINNNNNNNNNNINNNNDKNNNENKDNNADENKLELKEETLLKNLKDSNFIEIPPLKLDDKKYLTENYPLLFKNGSILKFKIQEFGNEGICIGNYRIGEIEDYSEENNSFLIKIYNTLNEENRKLLMYENEENELFIPMKNFVEIWIYNNDNLIINYEEKDNNLINDFLKRQIEFYFGDLNYEKDSYLKSCEDENGFIDLDILMKFNKIKLMTQDKNILINALKEKTDKIEFNENYSKIRKKKE